ncbi:hypothetical protein [Aquimarina longa]|uniref:hypothetical protein n=1 Tax=Aquimarina longa TaxID=1080221 RepID=UPI0007860C80|nr:hypothetical protein [Aquimarina longa]
MKVAYNFNESENNEVIEGSSENQRTKTEPSTNDIIPSGINEEPERIELEQTDGVGDPSRTETSKNGTEQELQTSEQEPQELSDDAFVTYLNKKNNTSFKSLEEYNNSLTKEIVKSPEYDEETTAFFRFKKDTGGSFREWVDLNQNIDEKSDFEIALDKIKKDNEGLQLSDSQASLLLAEDLGIDIYELEDLEDKEKLKLSILANKHKKSLKEVQEKYRQPIINQETKEAQSSSEQVMVAGQLMDKSEYDRQRKEYLSEREEAVNSIDAYDFSIEIDTKDGKKSQLDFKYIPTDEDKHSMLSVTESIDNILPNFLNEEGQLNHRSFNESIGFWANEQLREKAIKSISQQAYSAGIDAILKQERNINFDNKNMPSIVQKVPEGYGIVGAKKPDGVSVKYKFNEQI